jgi:hypothetical protein
VLQELRQLPGRGYAAFSTYQFQKGDTICTEAPVCWVHGHHPFSDGQIEEIESNLAGLEEPERLSVLEMANVYPEVACAGAGIFMTNSFDMTDAAQGPSCGLYCAIARLNHSCNPNAQQSHIPSTGEEILVATRQINVGDEINDCYIDLRQSRQQRQQSLHDLYRFQCGCASCSILDESSSSQEDKVRSRAFQLDNSVVSAAEEDADTALAVAEQYLSVLKSQSSEAKQSSSVAEASRGWSDRYIAGAHLYMYQIASALGKRKLAQQHIAEAHRWNVSLQGVDTPDSQQSLRLLSHYKSSIK